MSKQDFDITIIMAPLWHVGWPWTAPAYICESLRQKGYRVQFLDYNIRLYRACQELGLENLWTDDAYVQAWGRGELNYLVDLLDLDDVRGRFIGFSATQDNLSFSLAIAGRIKKAHPGRKIIFGGHGVFFPHEAARVPLASADAICKGEGEFTIREVMERGFDNLQDVAGLYLPGPDGKWRLTSERGDIADLDTVAFPRFSEIEYDLYAQRFLPVIGSRGCVGRCIFCADRYRAPGYRSRSAQHQVDELEYLSTHFTVEHFAYNDPLLNGDIGILSEKTNEIVRRGLRLQYGGNMMVRPDVPDELFPRLRESGMTVALVGMESGSATTLRHMRKRHNPGMAARFIRNLHNAGIRTELNFIVGFPTETEEHFQETLAWIRDNRPHIDAIISVPTFCMIPSDLWDLRERFGIEINIQNPTNDWHVRDGQNTFEIRQDRLERFVTAARDLGLIGERLVSDGHITNLRKAPTGREFLERYTAHWKSPDRPPAEREAALQAMTRLRASVEAQSLSPGLMGVAEKTLQSIRQRGLRQTVQRAREWVQIHRKGKKEVDTK